ncbi:MAG: hypothetical protein QHI38_07800 [Armatimonadota bacterium]|nr:hypothetical protein [Armatimonadota bacterium]
MKAVGRILIFAAAIALLMAVVAASAFSQTPSPPPGPGPRQAGNAAVFKELGLSQEQSQKIAAIVRKYRQDVGSIVRSSIPDAEKQKKIASLKSKAAAEISNVLTPAQRQKAKEKNLIERLLSRVPGEHARFAALLEQLNLTADQKTKVKAILDDLQAKTASIMSNTSLTRDQKRAKIAEARQQAMDKIKSLLTADQKKKLDELLKSRPGPGPMGGGPGPRGGRPRK